MLGAVLALIIMMSSVAFVITLDTPGVMSSYEAESERLTQAAREALEIANDWPSPSGPCNGSTMLDAAVVAAVGGDEAPLGARVAKLAGEHTLVNLDIDNLYGEYPIVHEFEGDANAAYALHYSPEPTWATILTHVDGVSGETMIADIAAFHDGELVRTKGEALTTTVILDDKHEYPVESVTALLSPLRDHDFAQNLSWLDEAGGVRMLTRQLLPEHVAGGLAQEVVRLWIRIEPASSTDPSLSPIVPDGQTLEVRIPSKWREVLPIAAGWNATIAGDESAGWEIIFAANGTKSTNQTFFIAAKAPTGTSRATDLITAKLGNGSLGESTLVVKYPTPTEQDLPRATYATTPYPLRLGTSAAFGAVFVNGGPEVNVRTLRLEVKGGYDLTHHHGMGAGIFHESTPEALNGTANGGAWRWVDNRTIEWNGDLVVPAGGVVDWLVGANVTEDASQATAVEPPGGHGVEGIVSFGNGFNTTSTTWGATPGVSRVVVVPDSLDTPDADGYDWTTLAPGEQEEHTITARVTSSSASVMTNASYRVEADASDLVSVRTALANGSMRVQSRTAPVGSLSAVDVDVESAVTTLAANGIADSRIQVDLYTPLSLGCAPTRSWSRDASSLPVAGITSALIFDESGLGVPSVYAAAEDKNVYRITSTGATAWAKTHASVPTALAAATLGVGERALFVGEVAGKLTRRDLVLAGEEVWSTSVEPPTLGGSTEVLAILANESDGRLLVQTPHVVQIRDAATGALIARRETGTLTDEYVQVAWAPAGGVYTLDTHRLSRLNADLEQEATFPIEDAQGFGLTESGVLVTRGATTTRLDPTFLTALDTIAHSGNAVVTSVGEATGDAIPDYVVALDSLVVQIVDGATGEIAQTRSTLLPDLESVGVDVPSFGPISLWSQGDNVGTGGVDPQYRPVTRGCPDSSFPGGTDPYEGCIDLQDPTNAKPYPLDVDADRGRVLLAYQVGGFNKLALWTCDAPDQRDFMFPAGVVLTSVGLGAWALDAPAILVATNQGEITPYDAVTTHPHFVAHPTRMVGRFTFNMRVPEGGFYGANLLITRLQWTDPALGEREARLWDWIHVVSANGEPVSKPQYLLRLQLQSAEYPPPAP